MIPTTRRRLATLAGTLAIGLIVAAGPAPEASAQAANQPCQTCDTLNARPGSGGPGFSDFQFWCVEGSNAGEVTVRVGTRGQPGVWTAGFGRTGHVIETTFEGSANLVAVGIDHGTTITRWLKNPAGRYVIAPRDEVFECGDCEQPPPVSTTAPLPPSSVPGSSTTVPHPPSSSPGTPPTLPPTGGDPAPIGLAALAAIAAGIVALYAARRLGAEG